MIGLKYRQQAKTNKKDILIFFFFFVTWNSKTNENSDFVLIYHAKLMAVLLNEI